MTAPGVSHYSDLAIASRIGPVERFPRTRSLANHFGLTPGCLNSGNDQDRMGSITKERGKIAPVSVRESGAALSEAGSVNAIVVLTHQKATRLQDCSRGSDAQDRYHLLAHVDLS
jgi:hypothetical protein